MSNNFQAGPSAEADFASSQFRTLNLARTVMELSPSVERQSDEEHEAVKPTMGTSLNYDRTSDQLQTTKPTSDASFERLLRLTAFALLIFLFLFTFISSDACHGPFASRYANCLQNVVGISETQAVPLADRVYRFRAALSEENETKRYLWETGDIEETREIALQVANSAATTGEKSAISLMPESIGLKLASMTESIWHIVNERRQLDDVMPALMQVGRQAEQTFSGLLAGVYNIDRRNQAYQEMAQYQSIYLNNVAAVGRLVQGADNLPDFLDEEVRAAKRAIADVEVEYDDKPFVKRLRPWLCTATWPYAHGVCPPAQNELKRQALLRFGQYLLAHIQDMLDKAKEAESSLELAIAAVRSIIRSESFGNHYYRLRNTQAVEDGEVSTWFLDTSAIADDGTAAMAVLLANYGALREAQRHVKSLTRQSKGLEAVFNAWNGQLARDHFGVDLAMVWNSNEFWKPYEQLSKSLHDANSKPPNETIFRILSSANWPELPLIRK